MQVQCNECDHSKLIPHSCGNRLYRTARITNRDAGWNASNKSECRARLLESLASEQLDVPKATPRNWVVDCKSVGSGAKALSYLGRYLYRGVVREKDILNISAEEVTYRYHESTGRTRVRTISGVTFLWNVLKHTLPQGFRRARNYGFLHHNSKRLIAFLPLVVVITTFLIIEFVPFTNLWLKADFAYYKNEREEIVQKVLRNELTSNVSHNSRLIKLNDSYSNVSMGGNEIVVEEHEGLKYVFFYTFRGILDNFSGFVFVPDTGKPEKYADLNESESTQISHCGGNWYYASHH